MKELFEPTALRAPQMGGSWLQGILCALDCLHVRRATSGVINVYDASNLSQHAKPIHNVLTLTTQVDGMSFNHDTQLMSIYSTLLPQSVRLVGCEACTGLTVLQVHVPSFTTFSNFPSRVGTQIANIVGTAFSPSSNYLAVGSTYGSDRAKVCLFRLSHYS